MLYFVRHWLRLTPLLKMSMTETWIDFMLRLRNLASFLGLKLSHLIFSATEQISISLQGKDILQSRIRFRVRVRVLKVSHFRRKYFEALHLVIN